MRNKKLKLNYSNTFRYHGNVTASLMYYDTIVQTYESHNSGTNNLFDFLAGCLAGEFNSAYVPAKIALFNLAEASEASFSSGTILTGALIYADGSAILDKTSHTVTYHFSIPYSYLVGTGVNGAALYPANAVFNETAKTNMYAKYIFKDANGNMIAIDSELTGANKGNYSIVIDWVLSIDNNEEEDN